MASSIFGGVADAITGGPKLKRVSYSGDLDTQLNELTGAQTGRRAADTADLALFGGAARNAAAGVEALAPGDQEIILDLIRNRTSNDPFSTYRNVGDYQFGLIDRLARNLAEQGRAGESRRMAALGYGGRGPSTYQTLTLTDRVSRNLSPVAAGALGNIGRDAASIEANRTGLNSDVLRLIAERAGIPTRSLPLYLAPVEARGAATRSQIADLLGLGEGFKTNTAGFREQQTALGSIADSLDSAVDTGLTLYSGGLFGGGMGGMFGGGAGGGTPKATNPSGGFSGGFTIPMAQPSYAQPYNYGMSYGWTPPWRN